MLMLIDVGNSNIVFGLMEEHILTAVFRQETKAERSAEEIAAQLTDQLWAAGAKSCQVADTIVASVVPQVMEPLKVAIVQVTGKPPLVIDEDIDPGLPYQAEERLGADRAVCCVAAEEKYGAPFLLLDFGTATTLDAVGEDGSYLGGCILAGVRTAANALYGNTALLPQIDLVYPATMLGRDAITQIQIGAVVGAVGSAEYLVRQVKDIMHWGEDIPVIATGGLASLIAEHADFIWQVDETLMLDGLALLYQRHKTRVQIQALTKHTAEETAETAEQVMNA